MQVHLMPQLLALPSVNIAGQAFDGSSNITIASTNLSDASTFNAPTALN